MKILKLAILALFLLLLVDRSQSKVYTRRFNYGYKWIITQRYTFKYYRYCYRYGYNKVQRRCYNRRAVYVISQKKTGRTYCRYFGNKSYRQAKCYRYNKKTRRWTIYYNRRVGAYRTCRWINYGSYKYLKCYYATYGLNCRRYGWKMRYSYCNVNWRWIQYSSKYYKLRAWCKWTYSGFYKYRQCFKRTGRRIVRYYNRRYNNGRSCRNIYVGAYRYYRCWTYYTRRICYRKGWQFNIGLVSCYLKAQYRLTYTKRYKRPAYCKWSLSRTRRYVACYKWQGNRLHRYYYQSYKRQWCNRRKYRGYTYVTCYKANYKPYCYYVFANRFCKNNVVTKMYLNTKVKRGHTCKNYYSGAYGWRRCYRYYRGNYRMYLNRRFKRKPWCRRFRSGYYNYVYCYRWIGNKYIRYVNRRYKRRIYYCRTLYDNRYAYRQCYGHKKYNYCYRYGVWKRYRRCYQRNGMYIYSNKRSYRKTYCIWTQFSKLYKYRQCYRRVGKTSRYIVYHRRRYNNRRYCRWEYSGAYRYLRCYYQRNYRRCVRYGYKMRYRRCYQAYGYYLYSSKRYKRNYCYWTFNKTYRYRRCFTWRGRYLRSKVRRYSNIRRCYNFYKGNYRYYRCFWYYTQKKCFKNYFGWRNYYCGRWVNYARWRVYYTKRYRRPGRWCKNVMRGNVRYYQCFYWRGNKVVRYHNRKYKAYQCKRWRSGWYQYYRCMRLVTYNNCRYVYDYRYCTKGLKWKITTYRKSFLKYSCRKVYRGIYEYRYCYRYAKFRTCVKYNKNRRTYCYGVWKHKLVSNKRYSRKYCRWFNYRTFRLKRCYILSRRRVCYKRLWRTRCRYQNYWRTYYNKRFPRKGARVCKWTYTLQWRIYRCYKNGKMIVNKKYRKTRYCSWKYSLKYKYYRCYRYVRYRHCYRYRYGRGFRTRCVYRYRYQLYYNKPYKRKSYCTNVNRGTYRYRLCYRLRYNRRYRRWRYVLYYRKRYIRKSYCVNRNSGSWRYNYCYRARYVRRCRVVRKRRLCKNVVVRKLVRKRKYRLRRYCVNRYRGAYRYLTCYLWTRLRKCRRVGRKVRCRYTKYHYRVASRRRYRRSYYCVNRYSGAWRYYQCYRWSRYSYCRTYKRFWRRVRKCYARYRYKRVVSRRYRRKVWCRASYKGMWKLSKCYIYKRVCRRVRKRTRCSYKYVYLRTKKSKRARYCVWNIGKNRNFKFYSCFRLRRYRRCRKSCRGSGKRRRCRNICRYYTKYVRYFRRRYRRRRRRFCRALNRGLYRITSCYKLTKKRVCYGRKRRRCYNRTVYKLIKRTKVKRTKYCINKYVGTWRYYRCFSKRRVRRCRRVRKRKVCSMVYRYVRYVNRRYRRKKYCTKSNRGPITYYRCYRYIRYRRCKVYRVGKRRIRRCGYVKGYRLYYRRNIRNKKYCKWSNRGIFRYLLCYKSVRRYRRCYRRFWTRKCYWRYQYKLVSRRKYRRKRYCRRVNRYSFSIVTCFAYRRTCKVVARKRRCRNSYKVVSRKVSRRNYWCKNVYRGRYRTYLCYRAKRRYRKCATVKKVRRCRTVVKYKLVRRSRYVRKRYCVKSRRGQWRYLSCYRVKRYRRCYRRFWTRKCYWRYKNVRYLRRRYRRKSFCSTMTRGKYKYVTCYKLKGRKYIVSKRYRKRKLYFCSGKKKRGFTKFTCYRLRILRRCVVVKGKKRCGKRFVYKFVRAFTRKDKKLRKRFCRRYRAGLYRIRVKCWKLTTTKRCWRLRKMRVCKTYRRYKLTSNKLVKRKRCPRGYRKVGKRCVKRRRRRRRRRKPIKGNYKAALRRACGRKPGTFWRMLKKLRYRNCRRVFNRRWRNRRRRRRRKGKYVYKWKKTCKRYRRRGKAFVRCWRYRVRYACKRFRKFRKCVRDKKYRGRMILIRKQVGGKIKLVCSCRKVKKRNGGLRLVCSCRKR